MFILAIKCGLSFPYCKIYLCSLFILYIVVIPLTVILICNFLMTNNAQQVFICSFAMCISLVRCTDLYPFKDDVLFIMELKEFFICSRYMFLLRYIIYNYFLPFCELFSYSLDSVVWHTTILVSFLFFGCSYWDLSSLMRNWTWALSNGSAESQPLDVQVSPVSFPFE